MRGDDGLGWQVVDRLAARPGVEAVTCIQLVPEHTDLVRQARRVLFVDIDQRLAPGVSRFVFVRPVESRPGAIGHQLGPAELLGFTRLYFGTAPSAAWLSGTGGLDLDVGERLTDLVAAAVPGITAQIERMLTYWAQCDALDRSAPAR
ncbi:MAG: hydrogenase maturation protease [Anaerolineales bacterium]|nr:hydrogenase maturation protease [Anaerolineales bacterium]